MVYRDNEQCVNCSEPIGDRGAWFWNRTRVCQDCYRRFSDGDFDDGSNLFRGIASALVIWSVGLSLLVIGWFHWR